VTDPGRVVFLSYASQDAQAAQKICEALRAAGIEVFLDQSELRGGDAWDQKIRHEIHDCALFVPLISAHSDARHEGYFRREWKLAVDRTADMSDRVAFLVPVVIDDTSDSRADVPERFRQVQWTRLPGGETPAAFVERIKRLLSPERSPLNAVSGAAPGLREPVRASRRSKPVLLAIVAVVLAMTSSADTRTRKPSLRKSRQQLAMPRRTSTPRSMRSGAIGRRRSNRSRWRGDCGIRAWSF
jgi:hypothetical protein